jgi:SWIM/SEC-C metal-binding protein
MVKLGSEKRPAILRVADENRAREMAQICSENGWHFIIGFEPDQPEDISDLEKLLNPPMPISNHNKLGRNNPCFCGSGKKFKKCCITA